MTVKCRRCKAANPDRKRFCGNCGAPLDPALEAINESMNAKVREHVRELIREHYKDQKLVELETSQAIAARLGEWAKLMAFFLGIPIALLLFLLGAFGIKTYSDFSSQVTKAQNEVTTRLDNAQKLATKLHSDGVALATEYEKLNAGLANTRTLSTRVEALAGEYDKLAEGLTKTQKLADRVDVLDKQIVNIAESLRSALVLGNNNYPKLPGAALMNAVSDAHAVGGKLQELGFKVTRGDNLRRLETIERLSEFTKQIEPGDTTFIFYSGHGIAVDGENYLLPTDIDEPSGNNWDRLRRMAIAESEIVSALKNSKSRVVVLVIDACRHNPFQAALTTKGISRFEPVPVGVPGFFKIYSAGLGQLALERLGAGDNSPNSLFTRALVNALGVPGLSLQEVVIKVREEVSDLAKSVGHQQTPAYYDETMGRIYLAGRTVDHERNLIRK